MSTRSNICRICKDGLLERVYCHYDGYFSGVGADLVEFCSTQEKVDLFFDKAALSDPDSSFVWSVQETLEKKKKPIAELGEVQLHLKEWDITKYLSEVKENISIEFLYIWVPVKFIKEHWIEEHIEDFRNLDKRPNNIEENGGVWITCDNKLRIWSWAEALAKGHKEFVHNGVGKLRNGFTSEDWLEYVYKYMLEREKSNSEDLFESGQSEKVEKKDSRNIEDYKNMVEGLHEIADKIKSADYLPKTLEAYDAYISALSYMVNKLKEDKVKLV